ncbi:hypothetical protein ES705_32587 [subsurface metagenome]|jgi:hypothetical protein
MANKCVHHWIIDSQNIGRCQKCQAVRDFSKLQRRLGQGQVPVARSEAAIKRWQDEEYREKQTAAHKNQWERKKAARGSPEPTKSPKGD